MFLEGRKSKSPSSDEVSISSRDVIIETDIPSHVNSETGSATIATDSVIIETCSVTIDMEVIVTEIDAEPATLTGSCDNTDALTPKLTHEVYKSVMSNNVMFSSDQPGPPDDVEVNPDLAVVVVDCPSSTDSTEAGCIPHGTVNDDLFDFSHNRSPVHSNNQTTDEKTTDTKTTDNTTTDNKTTDKSGIPPQCDYVTLNTRNVGTDVQNTPPVSFKSQNVSFKSQNVSSSEALSSGKYNVHSQYCPHEDTSLDESSNSHLEHSTDPDKTTDLPEDEVLTQSSLNAESNSTSNLNKNTELLLDSSQTVEHLKDLDSDQNLVPYSMLDSNSSRRVTHDSKIQVIGLDISDHKIPGTNSNIPDTNHNVPDHKIPDTGSNRLDSKIPDTNSNIPKSKIPQTILEVPDTILEVPDTILEAADASLEVPRSMPQDTSLDVGKILNDLETLDMGVLTLDNLGIPDPNIFSEGEEDPYDSDTSSSEVSSFGLSRTT